MNDMRTNGLQFVNSSASEIDAMAKLKGDSSNTLFNTPVVSSAIILSPMSEPSFTGMTNITPLNGFKLSFTGNTTINSKIITNISSTTGLVVGQELYQSTPAGSPVPDTIPRGAIITSIDSATQITINKPCLLTSTTEQILATNENIDLIGGVVGGYSNNLMVTSSTVGNVTPSQGVSHYAIEFMTNVADINTTTASIIFGVFQNGITPYNYRIAIDDVYQSVDSKPFNTGYVSIQFKSSGPHKVRLELPGLMLLQKIYITNNAKVWKPKQSKPVACFFGDSYFGGTDQTTLWGPQNLAFKIADSMGWNLFNCSVSGTGYISNGGSNYNWQHVKRLDDTLLRTVDIIILFGSINDNGNNQNTTRDAYLATWQGLRSRHPGVPIVIFGVPVTKSATISSISTLEMGMLEAFTLFGDSNSYLVPITLDATGAWLDENNVNIYIGADNSHLNYNGVKYLSKRMVTKIKEIVGIKDSNTINPLVGVNSSASEIDEAVANYNKTIGLSNKPIMIGAIGDSITRNQITMSDNGAWGVYYAWVGRNWLLRTAMKLNGRAWANIYAVEGYSGQRTDQIFDLMLDSTATINPTHTTPTKVGVLACKPDIVIEFSGTNDNYFDVNSKEAMVAGRRAIWQRLIDNGITPVALSLLPNSLTDARNTRIPEWNQAIKEEAVRMGIIFVDIYTNCANGTHFKDGWNWNNGVPDVIDGLHPGGEACEQISIDLAKALDKIIGTRVSTPTVYANTAIYTKPYDATKKGEEYRLFDTGLFPTIWNPRYENGNQTTTKTVEYNKNFSKYGNAFEIEVTNTTSSDGYSDFISPPLSVIAGEKHGVFFKYALEAINNTDDIQIGISYNTDYSNLIIFATGGNGNNASSTANGASIGGDFYQEITIPDGCTSIRIFLSLSTKANKNAGAKIKLSNYGTVRLH